MPQWKNLRICNIDEIDIETFKKLSLNDMGFANYNNNKRWGSLLKEKQTATLHTE